MSWTQEPKPSEMLPQQSSPHYLHKFYDSHGGLQQPGTFWQPASQVFQDQKTQSYWKENPITDHRSLNESPPQYPLRHDGNIAQSQISYDDGRNIGYQQHHESSPELQDHQSSSTEQSWKTSNTDTGQQGTSTEHLEYKNLRSFNSHLEFPENAVFSKDEFDRDLTAKEYAIAMCVAQRCPPGSLYTNRKVINQRLVLRGQGLPLRKRSKKKPEQSIAANQELYHALPPRTSSPHQMFQGMLIEVITFRKPENRSWMTINSNY